MSTIAPSKTKQIEAPAQDAVESKANAIAAQQAIEEAEYQAIVGPDQSFAKGVIATGYNTLVRLAREHGQSVDKFGYPALGVWRRFTNACAIRALDHTTFNRLCGVIRSAVGTDPDRRMSDEDIKTGREKCVTSLGKGAQGKSSMTLRIKAPKAWAIQLGE